MTITTSTNNKQTTPENYFIARGTPHQRILFTFVPHCFGTRKIFPVPFKINYNKDIKILIILHSYKEIFILASILVFTFKEPH